MSCLGVFSFNVCNFANADVPPATWNYKAISLVNKTPEIFTIEWDSGDPSTDKPFPFITTSDPITLSASASINVPIEKLINDADATFNIGVKSMTNEDLCAATFQGDGSIDVEPKVPDLYRCTASVSADETITFTISPSK